MNANASALYDWSSRPNPIHGYDVSIGLLYHG
jgi:hypothetical protein